MLFVFSWRLHYKLLIRLKSIDQLWTFKGFKGWSRYQLQFSENKNQCKFGPSFLSIMFCPFYKFSQFLLKCKYFALKGVHFISYYAQHQHFLETSIHSAIARPNTYLLPTKLLFRIFLKKLSRKIKICFPKLEILLCFQMTDFVSQMSELFLSPISKILSQMSKMFSQISKMLSKMLKIFHSKLQKYFVPNVKGILCNLSFSGDHQ